MFVYSFYVNLKKALEPKPETITEHKLHYHQVAPNVESNEENVAQRHYHGPDSTDPSDDLDSIDFGNIFTSREPHID